MALYQLKKSCKSSGLKPSQASPAQIKISASEGTSNFRYIPWVSEKAKILWPLYWMSITGDASRTSLHW